MKTLRSLLSTEYLSRFNEIEKIMYNIAGKTKIYFPTFTNHGTDHLKNVEKYVDLMIQEDIKEKMSQEEIFFLLCGVWLHDVGMVPKDEEELKFFKSLDPKDRDKFTIDIREMHHVRSYNYIKENYEELGINKLEAKIIGQIAKGHRKVELNNLEDINYNGISIKTSALASILRLADECDVSKERESSLSDIDIDEKTRRKYYEKIKLVNHVWFDYDKGIIYVSCICENKEDIDLVNEVIDEINEKLNQTKEHLLDFKIKFHDVQRDNQSDKIYEKVIISNIADATFEIDELSEQIPKNKIEQILENLKAEGLFKENDYSNGFKYEFNVYKKLFMKFKGPSNLKTFFFTKYSQDMVDIYFKDLTNKFDASFGDGRANRVAILKNSPTAFNFALTFEELIGDENFNSPDDGATIVDHLLIMSLFNDLNYYKDKIEFSDILESIGNLIENESEIFSKIKKHQIKNKIDKPQQDNSPYKFNSFDETNYLHSSRIKYTKLNKDTQKRELALKCVNLNDTYNMRPFLHQNSLNIKIGDITYEVDILKQRFTNNTLSFIFSSEELPMKIRLKINADTKNITCICYAKSDKIEDVLNWYKFKKGYGEQNILFELQNDFEISCKIPKTDNDLKLLEFYETINKLNEKLNLDMIHEEDYEITEKDYLYADYINSFLDNNYINVPSINVKINILVSELKEFINDDPLPIEVGYNHFPIKILNNNIDLGKYKVNILAAEIANKKEIEEMIKNKDLNENIEVNLTIKNQDSNYLCLDFN